MKDLSKTRRFPDATTAIWLAALLGIAGVGFGSAHLLASQSAPGPATVLRLATLAATVAWLMSGVFRPGQLFAFFEKMDVNLTLSSRRVIDEIMAISTETPMAVYGSGYW